MSLGSLADPPCVWISEPTAFDWTLLDDVKAAGFRAFTVRGQMGDEEFAGEPHAELVAFRDRARANGMACRLWVVLDVGDDIGSFDMAAAGRLASAQSRHFDGTDVQAEASLGLTLPFLDEFDYSGPLGVATLPTFEMGEPARRWDKRGAVLKQEAYVLENGHTPRMCRIWALDAPPVWVGWWYRATVQGRSVRVKLIGNDPGWYVVKEGRNTWGLSADDRRVIFNRKKPDRVVGKLGPLWNPARWKPILRTTPMGDGNTVPPEALATSVIAAGAPVADVYLGETTPPEFWRRYRLGR